MGYYLAITAIQILFRTPINEDLGATDTF